MALPLIAAGIAARAVAKKLATRAAGGITGAGAKQVTPIYRNSPVSKKMGDPRGVKTNQSGSVKVLTNIVKSNKSGQSAKEVAALRQVQNTFGNIPKKPTVKINSNPKRGK